MQFRLQKSEFANKTANRPFTPAEGQKMVDLITKGKAGNTGVFKFVGNIKKEEAEGLKAASSFYMFNGNVVWEK